MIGSAGDGVEIDASDPFGEAQPDRRGRFVLEELEQTQLGPARCPRCRHAFLRSCPRRALRRRPARSFHSRLRRRHSYEKILMPERLIRSLALVYFPE